MSCMLKKKKIHPSYVWKHNSKCRKKQVMFLTNNKWNGDFYCLNCFYSFRIKNKPELHKIVCENKDFCGVVMPSEDTR